MCEHIKALQFLPSDSPVGIFITRHCSTQLNPSIGGQEKGWSIIFTTKKPCEQSVTIQAQISHHLSKCDTNCN